jgi:hypothetical protein
VKPLKTPEHVDKRLPSRGKEPKEPKAVEPMAKPRGIERKGDKFKVFLDIEGKRVHIGYKKTLEEAKELLEEAKRDAGVDT